MASDDAGLDCCHDYPTKCLETVATVLELTCEHGHIVRSGRCAVHGEGESIAVGDEITSISCARCYRKGKGRHRCFCRASLRPALVKEQRHGK